MFSTHWHILLMDKVLKLVLLPNPKFIYRKAPNFGDKIVKKVLDPLTRPHSFWDRDGFFACRKCRACREVNRPIRGLGSFTSTSNNKEFSIKELITILHYNTKILY